MSEDVSHSPQEVAARRVGRPRTVETGGASLALLMRLVRSGIATTRSDLEREADLGRAAATDRLQTLQALGLIVEGDLGRAMGGRAPRIMRFRDEAGSVLAAVVDRTSLAVALTDLAGRLIVEHHEPADLAKGPEAILERLTTLFVWLLDERGGKQQAWGIGLSLPEPVVVDTTDGDAFEFLDLAVLEAWRHFDFESELSLRFGAPTRVHSSVQTMAVGEFKAGVAQDVSDFLFVKLDRSISAGAIMRGELSGGAQGFAGMIGHASTGAVSDRVCRCGNRGCLEALASGQAIAREGDRAARDGRSRYLCDMLGRNGEVTAIDVGHGAQLGDAFCAELLVNCGRLIGDALAPLANLLNPALIVLGGSVAQSGEILLAAVREAIYRRAHPLITRNLRVVRSQLGATAGLVGSAHAVLDEIFLPSMAQSWVVHGSPRKEHSFLARLDEMRARSREAARQLRPPAPADAIRR